LDQELKGEKIIKNDQKKMEKIAKLKKIKEKEIKEKKKERRRKQNSIRKKVKKKEEEILMQSLGIFKEKLAISKKKELSKFKPKDKNLDDNLNEQKLKIQYRQSIVKRERLFVEKKLEEMELQNKRVQMNIQKIKQKKQKSLDKLFIKYGINKN
jgi:hypothetical protein